MLSALTRHNGKNTRRGFSLTELSVVLSVISAMIGATWIAATNVQNAKHANEAAQDIMQIATNVRGVTTAINTFTDVNKDEVANGGFVAANLIPLDLVPDPVNKPTVTKNYWGGYVSVWENPNSISNRIFRVSFYGTTSDACFRIASQLTTLGTADGPLTLYTNSDGSKPIPIPTTGLATAAVQAACNKNNGSKNPSTEFDFEIH